MEPIAHTLARYFTTLSYNDIPEEKVTDLKWLVLDYLGVACRGAESASGRVAVKYATAQESCPIATLIGAKNRTAPGLAAFANAISAHSIEMDDVDDLALYHFSPVIVSAAMAMAERVDADGAQLLTAVYAGCEMLARLSNAVNPALRNRGFHTTPVCGVFGAAVSSGLLLKLNKEKMVSSLGLAGAQACGLMEMYGESMQKRFNPGPAAANGVMSAEMAKLGYTGTELIFEGKRGFLKAYADQSDESKLTGNLGREFPVHIDFKPYACARPIHNAIDCALAIRANKTLPAEEIKSITVYRHPEWAHYHVIYNPKNINEAQVSLPYSVAVALKEGDAFLDQYGERYLNDPAVMKLMDKVEVKADPKLPRGVSCLMTVETSHRQTYQAQVDYPKGSKENPMSPEERITKLTRLSSAVISNHEIQSLVETVLSLEKTSSVKKLIGFLQKGD